MNVTISGLTLANGNSVSSAGGLVNSGDLTLTDDVFSNNTGGMGGGIFNLSGTISMSGCSCSLTTLRAHRRAAGSSWTAVP